MLEKRISEVRGVDYERIRRQTDPKSAEEWNALAELAFSSNLDKEAVECIDRALEIDPNHRRSNLKKASALRRLGREGEGLAHYDRVLENDPDDANVWCYKGDLLSDLKRYSEAISCFDRALEIDPLFDDAISAWASRGHALFALKRYEEAIACFDRGLFGGELLQDDTSVALMGKTRRRSGIVGARPVDFRNT